jgi:NAD(P)-dependent dehydrogenase (short-subunit alcohol dehydrogenase family)
LNLYGKTAVVTGGGRGLGKAFSLRLAKEGADVAIFDNNIENAREVANEIAKSGKKALAVMCDVSNRQDVIKSTQEVLNEFKRIDILVNNAGISPPCSVLEMTEEAWDQTIDINLKGTFLCNQIIGRSMIENKLSGKIVNIASINAHFGAPNFSVYSASKGGVLSFTRTLAVEWAKYNISINSISPAVTMTEGVIEHYELIKDRVTRVPMKRFGEPDEIANLVLFLVDPETTYITGQDFKIDGGTCASHPAYVENKK